MALQSVVNLEKRIQEQGVVTLSMGELRDIFGAQRLGANVRFQIGETLRESGIEHLPEMLPNRESEMVRLFLADEPVRELMRAAIELSPDSDPILSQAVRAITVTPPKRIVGKRGRPKKRQLLSVG